VVARQGMSLQMGQVLFRVWRAQDGRARTYGIDRPGHQMALSRLTDAGLLSTKGENQRPTLAEDVMFCLSPAIEAARRGGGSDASHGTDGGDGASMAARSAVRRGA
jgi:hypothetical protein